MHRDSRGYWYQTKRNGQRVTREYIGRGLVADLTANLDQSDRDGVDVERAMRRAEIAKFDGLNRDVQTAFDAVQEVVKSTLEASGYHQHDRGQWRKRREQNTEQTNRD
jgi:hypothetical protein